MRIELPIREKTVVTREEFEEDYKRGYVALEYNPERQEVITDRRSGRQIVRTLAANIVFRCVDCQFDALDDEALVLEHRNLAQHPWKYSPFESPYGNVGMVTIEGIENYNEFLETKGN